jgi:conjugal transfer pilus assembly protein TraI
MRSLGVFALPRIVDADTLQYLARGNSVVVPQMLGSVSGMPSLREHNVLDQLVRRAAALVIDRDLRASADRYGKPILGSHLERYLLDGMRRLVVDSEAWKPNSERSRVWFGSDGAFIVWPNAAADLSKLLEADQLPGIPKSSETILEILLAAGVVQPQSETRATWDIYPLNAKKPIEAIRLVFPDILFAGSAGGPVALERALLVAEPDVIPPKTSPTRSPAPTVAVPGSELTPATQHQIPLALERHDPPPIAQAAAAAAAAVVEERDKASPSVDSPGSAAVTADVPPPVRFAFLSPSRLDPPVRQTLEGIIDSMNGSPADVAARTVAQGVFVPLKSFEARKVEPAIAVRALAEVEVLAIAPRTKAKTVVCEFCGETVNGVVILPRFVEGLDPSDFVAAHSNGGQ